MTLESIATRNRLFATRPTFRNLHLVFATSKARYNGDNATKLRKTSIIYLGSLLRLKKGCPFIEFEPKEAKRGDEDEDEDEDSEEDESEHVSDNSSQEGDDVDQSRASLLIVMGDVALSSHRRRTAIRRFS